MTSSRRFRRIFESSVYLTWIYLRRATKRLETIGACVSWVQGNPSLADDQMTRILLNKSGLEDLDVVNCKSLANEGFAPMLQLRKLRKLNLSCCVSQITGDFPCSLGSIPSLQDLNIEEGSRLIARSTDGGSLQSIPSLHNL